MGSGQFDSFSSSSGIHQKRRRSVSSIDEKIAAYMVKKAQKKAMHAAKKLKAAPTPYSNASNPFGDSNLNDRFIWKKKIERDVYKGASLESYTVQSEKKRQKAAMEEIAKLKKRREDRGLEKLKREEEIALLARERAHAEFHDWEKKEEEFDLEQRKLRSEIRLRARRAKPIDILTNHLMGGDDMDAGLLNQPAYMVLEGLSVEELEEVRDDVIKSTLNPNTDGAEYWKALLEVCNWKPGVHGEEERGLHGVEEDVTNDLESKTPQELEQLYSRVESHFSSGKGKVVEFWEAVLKKINLYKAKAYLREFHAKIYGNRVTPNDTSSPINFETSIEPEDVISMESEHGLRKPKYYYRVHLGFEWNKYNRTHYDHDNPPPKVVQGYKFDVYYPDLLDKTKTPTFTVEEDRETASSGSCIIRFHGGAPYEDVAFRIVNRDWEYKRNKGFRCTFEGGILRLYFNFKRYSYRR